MEEEKIWKHGERFENYVKYVLIFNDDMSLRGCVTECRARSRSFAFRSIESLCFMSPRHSYLKYGN